MSAQTENNLVSHPSRFFCPICGYPDLKEPPRSSSGAASHEICPCCGFHFGYDDDSEGLTYDEWRRRWVMEKKMAWHSRRTPSPSGWNPRQQLIDFARKFHVVRSQEEFDRLYK